MSSHKKLSISFPSSNIVFTIFIASSGSLLIIPFANLFIYVILGIPTKSLTLSSFISSVLTFLLLPHLLHSPPSR